MTPAPIPGYTAFTDAVARSPVTLAELELLKKTLLFGPEDVQALKRSRSILADQTEAILDVWYGFVGANAHLLQSFASPKSGEPQGADLDAVRKRFAQWIVDTASADYGQGWLDYQHEIGLRHHRSKKNKTDGAKAAEHVAFRYLPALLVPITTTLKPFLAKKGAPASDVEAMHAAWVKSVLLQTILWSHPYVKPGDF